MNSIDSFIYAPAIVSAALGILLIALLIITKIRNTAKISFVFFLAAGIFITGLLHVYVTGRIFYFFAALIASELSLFAYALVIALSDPEKRQEHKREKETKVRAGQDSGSMNIDIIEDYKQEFKRQLEVNRDFTVKSADFFNDDDTMFSFLEYAAKIMADKTKADGAAVLLLDDFENALAVKVVFGDFPPPYKLPDDLPHKPSRITMNFKFAQFPLEGNIFGSIFAEGKPVNIKNPAKDERIVKNGPEDFLRPGPYAFIPIALNGQPTVLICLAKKPTSAPFSDDEFEAAQNLADAVNTALYPVSSFVSYAEHMELTKEGDIATKFQKSLLPEKMPVISRISIGKYSIPAENVCGDYYDIIPVRKDRIIFVMGDIAGKGMNSLVIMVMIRAMLRLVANTEQSMSTLLEWANKAICSERNSLDHFASVALINYNSATNTAQIATCGINPVILYSAKDSSIKKISLESEPIGVEKTTEYRNIDISLEKGDILITCTDGLLECLNEDGVQYSLDNLYGVVKLNAKLDGKEIADKIKAHIKRFFGSAQQYDDQSLLVVKIQG